MNKTKKLLSVVLAIVMALSCMSVTASAAVTKYQTVADLEALDAYSPYGQVTRLSTEERASIVQDFLDNLLPTLGINMGEVFNVLGLSITIDLSSVDRLCYSLDTVKDTLSNGLASIAMGIVNLGVLEQLNMDTWNTGIDRAGDSQLTLFAELFELLSNNTGLVNSILTNGLDLGLVGGLLGGVDLSSINEMVTDLPSLVKGLVFPLIERWDDSLTLIKTYDTRTKGNGNVENTVQERVQKLFSDNMSITTIKYDANGNMTSEHTNWLATATGSAAPTASDDSLRYYYQINGSTMQSYHIVDAKEAEALAKDTDETNNVAAYNYIKENQVYRLEQEVPGSATYVWKAYKLDENGAVEKDANGEDIYLGTLKYYNDDSQLLKGFDASQIKLNDANVSAGDLLYTFIPTVFDKLATVVLNGSVKKALAEFFGAKFNHIGVAGTDEVVSLGNDPIFAEEQGEYVFEWSDYAIVDGVHYYRYLDDVYVADLSATNNYFDVIDWEFEITGDFMNQFIPSNDDNVSNRLLLNLNDFLIKVADTVLVDSVMTEDSISGETAQWTKPDFVSGSNSNLIPNIKALAQTFVKLAPEHIFGSDYETNPRCYYDLLVAEENDTVLTGIAAQLVDILMPSMTLPAADHILSSGAKVGAILAAAVREFAAYLAPEYNFDALIYTDFGENDGEKNFVTGVDSEYWFDVILTMGINVGFEYLRAFADMGEGTTEWNSFVAYSGYGVDGKTYAAGTTREALNAEWEGMLDYIIDWALDKDYEWSWKMENLVEVDGLTVDMTTAQDPFVKLQKILGDILPVDEILTVEPAEGETKFEHWLRQDLILGIVDLEWDHLINTIQFNGPNKYFRNGDILQQLANLVKGIVNSLLDKVGGGDYKLIPDAVTDFDSLASQANIRTLAVNLVGKLKTAYDNKLLDTVLPFLNFLFGWKTDPQKIADPQIWTDFRNGNDYAYLYDNSKANQVQPGGAINGDGLNFTKIKILNNSAGMLETHRKSSVADHAYDIQIKSVTSDATTNTLTFTYGDGNGLVSPYETLDIIIGGTYNGEESTTITIAYDYVGKDGQPIGGTQYTSLTVLFSNQYEDTNVSGRWENDDDDDYAGTDDFGRYQFTKDIYNTVVNYQARIFYVGSTFSNPSKSLGTIAAPDYSGGDCDGNGRTYYYMTEPASTYFDFRAGDADAGWKTTLSKDSGDSYGYLYKAKEGVTAETEFPYGAYYMGRIAVGYGSDNKTYEIDFIYYNDYNIYDIYLENKDNGYHANQGVDPAIYNEYNEAWKLIVYGATYPMMTKANGHAATDYVDTIQPYIPAAIERFEAAKEAYETALAEAQASASGDAAAAALPSYVTALRQEIDNDFMNGKEINFQDYEFYEYFNYSDVKTEAENLYRSYLAPEVLDTYHIFRSGIREAELNFVLEAETNATKKAAIEASRRVHDQAAIDASIAAQEEWKQPINTRLIVDDLTSRLAFYKQFLNAANMEDANRDEAAHLKFLEKEIAFVEAQSLVEEDYEEVTWGRYADALAEAKAVAAGEDEFSSFNSRIYDVKYNLMVAYKQLLKKADSLIEAGGTADLLANIEIAEGILAMSLEEIELSDIAIEKGLTKEQALGHLIEGLGYYYQARYSKHDIEVQDGEKTAGELKYNDDGTPMMFNLYDESAYEYADNDRPNKQANQAKVNAANNNLEACIAYFVTEEELPTLVVKPSEEYPEYEEYAEFVVVDTANNNYEEFTGIIYGMDVLDQNPDAAPLIESIAAMLAPSTDVETHIEILANEETGAENTTGAIINILDDEGNVLETYRYVYFGDVDADGMITSTDAWMAGEYEVTYGEITSFASYVAADVDGDGMVTSTDAWMMGEFEVAYTEIDFQYNIGQMAVNNSYEWIY